MNMQRRDFLRCAGAAAVGGASAAATAIGGLGAAMMTYSSVSRSDTRRYELGIQFFTFNALATQGWDKFSEAMGIARGLGYEAIQFAGLMGHSPALVRKRAAELGLALRTMHIGNDQVRAFRAPGGSISEAQDAVYTPTGIVQLTRVNVPLARDLGCEWAVVAASGPTNMQSLDNVRRMCDALNAANEIARKAGIGLSYHGHGPDYRSLQGQNVFEFMLAHTEPTIRFELDVAWVAAGGADPVALIDKHAARIVSFHLKDWTQAGKAATVGDGQIDFAGIYRAAARIDKPIFNVECEGGPGVDLTREARRSLEHLRPLGWTLTA
ncbi:xylose isomerase [Steroidobacter agaridevorans]|uniref:Xylose isomerase n=1 Tax=Steroidobacter agaridevorans TaxID=2695856 RepID=A0A829YGF2_9GAMM|nr:sugar phosphate isomerase/epimerase [Steroidobacter agaridevorans]GFE82334.1 xylose isomerase [Steroidobacter agaridevorans]